MENTKVTSILKRGVYAYVKDRKEVYLPEDQNALLRYSESYQIRLSAKGHEVTVYRITPKPEVSIEDIWRHAENWNITPIPEYTICSMKEENDERATLKLLSHVFKGWFIGHIKYGLEFKNCNCKGDYLVFMKNCNLSFVDGAKLLFLENCTISELKKKFIFLMHDCRIMKLRDCNVQRIQQSQVIACKDSMVKDVEDNSYLSYVTGCSLVRRVDETSSIAEIDDRATILEYYGTKFTTVVKGMGSILQSGEGQSFEIKDYGMVVGNRLVSDVKPSIPNEYHLHGKAFYVYTNEHGLREMKQVSDITDTEKGTIFSMFRKKYQRAHTV